MRKVLALLIVTALSAVAATQNIIQDTATHKVIKPPAAPGAAYDIDFSNVTTNISGGGGGGTPGGNPQQLQFNNAFIFGGIPYATYDGSTVMFRTGPRFTFSDVTDASKRFQINLGAFSGGT